MSSQNETHRSNPGPSWGYRFLRAADFVTPEFIYKPIRATGTFIAMVFMPAQRRHSREYLTFALGRRPSWRDVFKHFFALEESLMTKLRVLNGLPYRTVYSPSAADAEQWKVTGEPVFLGTFHVGDSDLIGAEIVDERYAAVHKKIHIVRERVGNSHDVEKLTAQYGERIAFIWVNDPQELVFALKDAAATDASIALQCDRCEHSARSAEFDFFGVKRRFPITIYILASIFKRPVILSIGIPTSRGLGMIHSTPRFEVIAGESRSATLARGQKHFQEFLNLLESLLRKDPYLWFNFIPWSAGETATEARTNQPT